MHTLLLFSVMGLTTGCLLLGTVTAQENKPGTRKQPQADQTDRSLAKLGTRKIQYKKVGDISLNLWFFYPKGHATTDQRPAIVFFFGGGWNGGTPTQFTDQSQYLVSSARQQYRHRYLVPAVPVPDIENH